jgi:hypothetical protein
VDAVWKAALTATKLQTTDSGVRGHKGKTAPLAIHVSHANAVATDGDVDLSDAPTAFSSLWGDDFFDADCGVDAHSGDGSIAVQPGPIKRKPSVDTLPKPPKNLKLEPAPTKMTYAGILTQGSMAVLGALRLVTESESPDSGNTLFLSVHPYAYIYTYLSMGFQTSTS